MRIGIAATRLAGVDGVTFETVKWETVLEELGDEVRLVAGDVDALRPNTRLIPPMHFTHPPVLEVAAAAFDPATDKVELRRKIRRLADQLLPPLLDWVERNRLDAMIVENAWAIPMHLPLGMALRDLAVETGLFAIGHHHDYWWERERFATCVVPDVLEAAFPPDLPNVRHVSINSIAAAELRERRGLTSRVIPNVFDFDKARPRAARRDQVRARLRAELGMDERGLLVVQPTRVVPRKGIELAIELVGRLRDPHAVLLITGPAGDEGTEYLETLERLADRWNVRLRYAAERFAPDHVGKRINPAHSLSDAYLAADLVTYPSLYEGFGNALVEALFYGTPVVVNRYAVYEADIRPLGLRMIEIDGVITDATVSDVRTVLADPQRRAHDARHNFGVGREHLGYDVLRHALAALLS